MGIFEKMKEIIGIGEIEDDEIAEEELIRTVERQQPKKNFETPNINKLNINAENIVRMTTTTPDRGTNSFKLMVIEPKGFEECPRFVDLLKARKPVILNLEKIDVDTARKIFDFLSGATYALNGTVESVTGDIFVFAPETVGVIVQAEEKEESFSYR